MVKNIQVKKPLSWLDYLISIYSRKTFAIASKTSSSLSLNLQKTFAIQRKTVKVLSLNGLHYNSVIYS